MLVPKIDIHAHVTPVHEYPSTPEHTFLLPEELRAKYDKIGVERGVQLPFSAPGLETDLLNNRESRLLTRDHPQTVGWWFCNVDPRWNRNSEDTDLSLYLRHFKEAGARGVGELTSHLYFDDPLMDNLFFHCEQCGMPVLFHIGRPGNGDYGVIDDLGLPRLERALKKFSGLRFIGHSQKFWSQISGDCTEEIRGLRPPTPVTPGGRLLELMRTYPNLYGDLSAMSGANAVMRDPEFGYAFMEEFQDRLYFGVDYCSIYDKPNPLSHYLDEAVEGGRISQQTYNKICRENALALLERQEEAV